MMGSRWWFRLAVQKRDDEKMAGKNQEEKMVMERMV